MFVYDRGGVRAEGFSSFFIFFFRKSISKGYCRVVLRHVPPRYIRTGVRIFGGLFREFDTCLKSIKNYGLLVACFFGIVN